MRPRNRLIQRRKQLGLKQEDVARAVGITREFYGMIERGKRRANVDLALRIAAVLGDTVEHLFGDTGEPLRQRESA